MSPRTKSTQIETSHPIFNLLKYGEIDYDALDRDFTWTMVTCENYTILNKLVDLIAPEKMVRAIKFEPYSDDESSFYIMCDKTMTRDDISGLVETIIGREDSKKVTIQTIPSKKLPKRKLFQLLLNSLGKNRLQEASNAQGRLFRVVDKIDKVWNFDEFVASYIAMEFIVSDTPEALKDYSDLSLDFKVIRFNNALRKDINWKDRKPYEFPRFRYVPGEGMKISPPGKDDGRTFVMRSCRSDEKTHLDLLNFSTLGLKEENWSSITDTNFKRSRAYQIKILLDKLNSVYSKYLGEVSLLKTESTVVPLVSMKEYLDKLKPHFENTPIFLINQTGDETKDEPIQEFAEIIKKHYGFDIRFSNQDHVNVVCIPVIQPKDYYLKNKKNDPHRDKDCNVSQHITITHLEDTLRGYKRDSKKKQTMLENKRNKWAAESPDRDPEDYPEQQTNPNMPLIDTVFEQIYIKQDIENGRLEFFDWGRLGYTGDWKFAIPLRHKEKNRYVLDGYGQFTIHSDGLLEKPEKYHPSDPFSGDFSDVNWGTDSISDVDFAIKDPEGHINIVRKTNIRTIPNVDAIINTIKENKDNNRGRTIGLKIGNAKYEHFGGNTGIGFLTIEDNKWAYYVGLNNMNQTIPNSSLVRIIEGINENEIFFERIFFMMSVPFIKHKQLADIPFPIKYLNEWCTQLGYIKTSEQSNDMN